MLARTLERFSTMVVLVVDDNLGNVLLLRSLLVQQGIERVVTETDARKVGEVLDEVRPDLVLLDLHMPNMDGFEVLAQIQAYAAGAYLPVLVLTADTTTNARNRALGLGAQDFLTKPLDTTETCLRIANLLQTRELYATLRQTNHAIAAPRDEDAVLMRKRIENVLRNGSRAMVYQPVVDTATMQVVGHE